MKFITFGFMVLMPLLSGVSTAQLTWEDIRAGHEENLVQLVDAGIDIQWSVRHRVLKSAHENEQRKIGILEKSLKNTNDEEKKIDLKAKIDLATKKIEHWQAFNYGERFQVYLSRKGFRIRFDRSDSELEGTFPEHSWLFPDNETQRPFQTYTQEFGKDQVILTTSSPRRGYQISEVRLAEIIRPNLPALINSPIPFSFDEKAQSFLSVTHSNGLAAITPSNKAVRYTVEKMEGTMARVSVLSMPEFTSSEPEVKGKFGYITELDIDTSKGFIPTKIKSRPIVILSWKIGEGFQKSDHWNSVIEIEIGETASGAFYPKKVHHTKFESALNEKRTVEADFFDIFHTLVDEGEALVPTQELVLEVIAVKPWSEPDDNFYDFEKNRPGVELGDRETYPRR